MSQVSSDIVSGFGYTQSFKCDESTIPPELVEVWSRFCSCGRTCIEATNISKHFQWAWSSTPRYAQITLNDNQTSISTHLVSALRLGGILGSKFHPHVTVVL